MQLTLADMFVALEKIKLLLLGFSRRGYNNVMGAAIKPAGQHDDSSTLPSTDMYITQHAIHVKQVVLKNTDIK